LEITDAWLESVRSTIPSLPHELFDKFVNEYKLPEYDAGVLTDTKEIALYFEELCRHTKNYKAASNWVMGPVKSHLNELTLHVEDFSIKPSEIAELIQMIDDGLVSFSVASQKVYPLMLQNPGKHPKELAEMNNLLQESDDGLIQSLIDEVLNQFPDKVAEYKSGKKGILGLFMGEVMKKSKGKADPRKANSLLKEKLEN
jgi:aspartyl-tRNA(Asn)/glutamyl-tRNA(Gln) amidotransferase subunit B